MRFQTIDEWERAIDIVTAAAWMRCGALGEGEGLAFDPRNPELPASFVIDDDDETDVPKEVRLRVLQRLLDFIWGIGPKPMAALKRLYAITRRGSPTHLYFMSQEQVAVLNNETRAATQTREEKDWEDFVRLASGARVVGTAGSKSKQAKARYSTLRKDNHCRVGGHMAERQVSALRRPVKRKRAVKAAAPETKSPSL